jgi:hypothetical protein
MMKKAAVSIVVVFMTLMYCAVVFAAPAAETNQVGWGEAVEGVQVRLRADKKVWKEGEMPTFKADVRNVGTWEMLVWQTCLLHCEIELDGEWYRLGVVSRQGASVKSSAFPPGRQYSDIPINFGGTSWITTKGDRTQPLRFRPGRHVVRVAITAWPAEPDKGKRVRAISNPVEIRIEEDLLGRQARIVVPMGGLDELMEMFEKETVLDPREEAEFESFERKARAHYDAKGRPEWMKDAKYYKKLDTPELAEECLSRPSFFPSRVRIYNDPRYGMSRLKAEHPGFDELFKRKDMWRGILHANEYLSSKLDPNERDKGKALSYAEALGTLRYLYALPPLKEQIKGKERLFLASNLRVLKRFKWFIENANAKVFIYPEPVWASEVPLILARRVDPQRYARIEPTIMSVRFTQEQRIQDVLGFISLVIDSLEGFVPE